MNQAQVRRRMQHLLRLPWPAFTAGVRAHAEPILVGAEADARRWLARSKTDDALVRRIAAGEVRDLARTWRRLDAPGSLDRVKSLGVELWNGKLRRRDLPRALKLYEAAANADQAWAI